MDYGNGHLAACHHPLNVDEATLARVAASQKHTPEAADEGALPEDPGRESLSPSRGGDSSETAASLKRGKPGR